MKTIISAVALCLMTEAGLAAEPCLKQDQIDGIVNDALHDSHSVLLRDRNGLVFQMHFSGWCQGLNFKTASSSTATCIRPGDWFVSYGDTAKYTFGDVGKPMGVRCIVSKVEIYDPGKAERESGQ